MWFPHNPDNQISLTFSVVVPLFHPEYGRFMLESTPGAPYSNKVTDLLTVEGNMRYRFGVDSSSKPLFLIFDPKTFTRPEASEEERNTNDHHLLPPPRSSGTVHRSTFRPTRRCFESQFILARGDYESSRTISVS